MRLPPPRRRRGRPHARRARPRRRAIVPRRGRPASCEHLRVSETTGCAGVGGEKRRAPGGQDRLRRARVLPAGIAWPSRARPRGRLGVRQSRPEPPPTHSPVPVRFESAAFPRTSSRHRSRLVEPLPGIRRLFVESDPIQRRRQVEPGGRILRRSRDRFACRIDRAHRDQVLMSSRPASSRCAAARSTSSSGVAPPAASASLRRATAPSASPVRSATRRRNAARPVSDWSPLVADESRHPAGRRRRQRRSARPTVGSPRGGDATHALAAAQQRRRGCHLPTRGHSLPIGRTPWCRRQTPQPPRCESYGSAMCFAGSDIVDAALWSVARRVLSAVPGAMSLPRFCRRCRMLDRHAR